MFYIDKLVNLALGHSNKSLFLVTVILTVIMNGDFPPGGGY